MPWIITIQLLKSEGHQMIGLLLRCQWKDMPPQSCYMDLLNKMHLPQIHRVFSEMKRHGEKAQLNLGIPKIQLNILQQRKKEANQMQHRT